VDADQLLDADAKSVVIVMTSGPSTPHRCATPFYVGAILAAMDAEVNIFLTMEAVRLAERGIADQLAAVPGGKRIIDFIRDAKHAGVKLHLCLPALPGYDIDDSAGIIAEVDALSGGGVLADLILSCDKVLSF
jgi:predicted peroxiredoxin